MHKKTGPLLAGLHKERVRSMTDTVIVALITFASGLFGSGIGAFVTLKISARESARRVHDQKHVCFTQFVSTYYAFKHELDIALLAVGAPPSEKMKELHTQFQAAYSSALLVCAQSTIKLLNTFYFQLEQYYITGNAPTDLDLAYESALKAMRKELHISKTAE